MRERFISETVVGPILGPSSTALVSEAGRASIEEDEGLILASIPERSANVMGVKWSRKEGRGLLIEGKADEGIMLDLTCSTLLAKYLRKLLQSILEEMGVTGPIGETNVLMVLNRTLELPLLDAITFSK